jgi:hypothetical protein
METRLSFTSALELARLIRDKDVSLVEVVEASLHRIENLNPTLNSFCFTYPHEALDKARAAERAVMRGEPLGALHGVPIAIKDLTPTLGKRTTKGSYIHERDVPGHDAVVVERLLAAGGIMVGKTTTPEYAYTFITQSPLLGGDSKPLELGAHPWWFFRWFRGCGGDRVCCACGRIRHGRLSAAPRFVLGRRRSEAKLCPYSIRHPAKPVRLNLSLWPACSQR